MNADAIPEDLKGRAQWLVWSHESDPPKRPLNADGYGAQWGDPGNWLTFEDATAAVEANDQLAGVGFVIDENDPYIGVDLDGCLREPGEAKPKDWLPSLEGFNGETYIEYSQSGTGLHVFAKDTEIPSWWSDGHFSAEEHEGVEVAENGFFIVTGDTAETSTDTIGTPDLASFLAPAYRALYEEPPAPFQDDESSGPDGDDSTDTESTGNVDEIIAALDSLSPSDLPLSSRHVEKETRGVESWDPGYRQSESGKSLKRFTDSGKFVDMMNPEEPFSVLELFAAENGIITDPHDELSGDDWWDAIEAAREHGAPIPEYESGSTLSLETDASGGGGSSGAEWDDIRTAYSDPETPNKRARQAAAFKLANEMDFITPTDTEELYAYHEPSGVFERGGRRDVEQALVSGLGAHYTQHEKNEIIGKLKPLTYVDPEELDAGEHDDPLICAGNGVLNVETREFGEHSPEYKFTWGLEWDYDPDASADEIREFVESITEKEAHEKVLYEMVGNTLLPHYDYRSILVLFGEGKNGKSTFYDVVTEFLDRSNVSGVTMQKMAESQFAMHTIDGNLANIAPDMPSKKVSDLGMLKALTGGDLMEVEPKGAESYETVNRAKMMFGANRPPILGDRSDAVKDRLYPIRLPYKFTDDPDDGNPDKIEKRELKGKLVSEEQMSGLLNLALDGIDRLRENGDFSHPLAPDERLEYYEQFSDPIKQFAVNCLETAEGDHITKDDVYNAYTNFCQQENHNNTGRQTFFSQLRQTTFEYSETRPNNPDGSRPRCLDNARFSSTAIEKYVPDLARSRYDSPDRPDSPDTDESNPESTQALGAVELGHQRTFTAEVSAVSDGEYSREAQGKLKGQHGTFIGFVVPGGNENPLEARQGDTFRFEDVTVRTDDDGLREAVINDAATITELDDTDATGLDDHGGEADAAATDGGKATASGAVDVDGEGIEADTRRVQNVLEGMDTPVSEGALVQAATSEHEHMDPDRVGDALERAKERGDVIEQAEGYELNR